MTHLLPNIMLSLFLAGSLAACRTSDPDSRPDDIFTADRGPDGLARRHKATPEETKWTIAMGRCTGHLISPEYMMTANHCKVQPGETFTSGSAINRNLRGDIKTVSVPENDFDLDYSIVKIAWKGAVPPDQKFPPLVPTSAADVATSPAPGQGDEVFSVGYPTDKSGQWGATYAQGQLKQVYSNRLKYNMSTINGNSGGGVWRKRDNMLVSLTNKGPHMFGQDGWDQGDINDPDAWNSGAAMWLIYQKSRILQNIFPGGKNRFAAPDGPVQTSPGLFVMLGASDAANGFSVFLSAPKLTHKAFMCPNVASSACTETSTGARIFQYKAGISSDRFLFESREFFNLSSGAQFSVVGVDAAGQLVSSRAIRISTQQ